jgi:signal transduction histidine kinase
MLPLIQDRPLSSELASFIQRLSFQRDMDTIMALVRDAARALTGADGVTFVLREGDTCFYADEDAVAPLWKGQHFPLRTCISGWVMLNQQPAVIEDIYSDPRIPHSVYRSTFVKSLIMMPVRSEDPIAAIGAYWATRHQPTDTEVALLHAIAQVAAVALINVRLYQSQRCALEQAERALADRLDAEQALRNAQSALKLANHDLRLTNERLSLALRGAHAGTWDWDIIDGRAIWSKEYYELHGFDRATTPASFQTWLSSVHQDDRVRVEHALQNWQDGRKGDFILEYRIHHPDKGVRWLADRGHILYDAQGRPTRAIGLVLDITELRQIESEAHQARDTAEQADAAKSRFLAAASHDLRQPVQAAVLFLNLLERRDLDPPTRTLVDQVVSAVNGVQGLLDGLLELARLEAGVIVPEIGAVVLDELLARLAQEFDGLARAAALWLRMPPSGLVVASDPLLLEQILRNLIANAIKYTTLGGVTVECRDDDRLVRIAVIDTGSGIPAHQCETIFEEFHQLDNPARDRGRGVGLGLAVVDRAARLLGSHVIVRSELGSGSEFSLTLPRSHGPAVRPPAEPSTDCPVIGNHVAGRRIVVVEDDPGVRLALEMLLQDWGWGVEAASSLEEAADLVEQLTQAPDVLLVDYRLPGGACGTEAVKLMHHRWPVPAIVMTGDTAPERLIEAQRSGCWVLHKPVDPEALRQALLACL